MKEKEIKALLGKIIHPETGKDIVSEGMVRRAEADGDKIIISIALKRQRDPFVGTIKREVEKVIAEAFPAAQATVVFEEPPVRSRREAQHHPENPKGTGCVIAVASGKGGVGKSTVTASLAVTLAGMGYRVGILDADIYGPSQPEMFGVADYRPEVETRGGEEVMKPADAAGIKIMSIGFFIDPQDALAWRGPMATSALKQIIHQTLWGELDYLLIDMPPGTGDVHLTVLQEMKISGAVIVSTPQAIALADVVRGISLFRAEKIAVPVLGIVENMSWFTPAEAPGRKYYIFGEGGAAKLAEKEGLPLLGEVPLVMGEGRQPGGGLLKYVENQVLNDTYISIAQNIIRMIKC